MRRKWWLRVQDSVAQNRESNAVSTFFTQKDTRNHKEQKASQQLQRVQVQTSNDVSTEQYIRKNISKPPFAHFKNHDMI